MAGRYGKGHEHIDDAAAAALYALSQQPRVADQEYMGLLIKGDDGKYYRTDLQTDGRRDSSSWTGYPEGELSGIVHSHPARRHFDKYPHTHFSDTDVRTARKAGVPSYIHAVDEAGGQDRKFTPGATQVRRSLARTNGVGFNDDRSSPGEEFLAQFPIEEWRMYLMRQLLERAPDDPRGLLR